MRRQVLSKENRRQSRMYQDHSQPVLFQRQGGILHPTRHTRVSQHNRSKTKLFQQDPNTKIYLPNRTPAYYFPKVFQSYQPTSTVIHQNDRDGLDALQTYIHKLLHKNYYKFQEDKHIKESFNKKDRRKREKVEKQNMATKDRQGKRLLQLKTRLREAIGQLAVQEKKLQVGYAIEEKMEKKYNAIFDRINRKLYKDEKQTTEFAQNTDETQHPLTKKRNLLSKFRIAAYVVYFSLFFPKYSKMFHRVKKKDFLSKIINENGIRNQVQGCYKLFQQMKIKMFWTQLQYKNKNLSNEEVSVIFQEGEESDMNQSFKKENINSLLRHILSNIVKGIKDNKVDDFIKILTFALTNGSFIADSFFLEQQLYQLNISQNLVMNLSNNQQKILLINFILIKLASFGFMMSHLNTDFNEDNYIFSRQVHDSSDASHPIAKQLFICGLYLIKLCNQVNKTIRETNDGNIEQMSEESLPEPMEELEFKTTISVIVSNKEENEKRTSIQDRIGDAENEGIQVKNTDKLSELLDTMEKNEAEPEISGLIVSIREQVFKKMRECKKQLYRQYSEQALSQLKEKKVVSNGQPDEDVCLYQDRSQEQKEKISGYCNLFKARRPNKEPQPILQEIHPEIQQQQQANLKEAQNNGQQPPTTPNQQIQTNSEEQLQTQDQRKSIAQI